MENKELILRLLQEYGYIGIYFLFVVDTLGVFLPSKTMLVISGLLISQGYLQYGPLFIAALSGSLTGFLTGYTIGVKVGKPFLERYGRFMHLTQERLERTENWFARHGAAAILVAYFIPGLRHIVPYLSGIAKMPFQKVICFAFTGAALWILTFTSIGRFFGSRWPVVENVIRTYIPEIAIITAAIILLVFLIRIKYKQQIKNE